MIRATRQSDFSAQHCPNCNWLLSIGELLQLKNGPLVCGCCGQRLECVRSRDVTTLRVVREVLRTEDNTVDWIKVV